LEGGCALRLHVRGTIIRSDTKKAAMQITYHEFRTASVRTRVQSSAR
jgi:hypothetical protein